MEDTETCSSRAVDFAPTLSRKQRQKVEVYNQVLHRLRDLSFAETSLPDFEDELWAHFHRLPARAMHEITISTNDKPKLFSQLSSLLYDVGLNIQEAHAFSTTDGYSLFFFVVDGWALEGVYKCRRC